MKRPVIVLIVIALLGIISPGPPVFAQPSQIPHEDPDATIITFNTAAFLLSYSRIISLAIDRNYREANDILDEINNTDIPEDMRYIIDRYNDIYQQLFTTMENLDSYLDEAAELLSHNRVNEAKQKISAAEVEIDKATDLLEEIQVATYMLSSKIGVIAGSASNAVKSAHNRLEESLERFAQLLNELQQLLDSLDTKYTETKNLIPTHLSLNIAPASAFVGDNITVSGKLSGGGFPLAGRIIHLTYKEITTVEDGSYTTNITVPYEYKDNLNLVAAYYPAGNDTAKYLATESPPQSINTKYYRTFLELSVDESIHLGLPFNISGRVSSTRPDSERLISVFLGGSLLAEEKVAGDFNLYVNLPESTQTGEHVLKVAVKPHGRYSGLSETRILKITRLPVYLDVQIPGIMFLMKTLQISGRLYNDIVPIPDALIGIDFKGSSKTVKTSSKGDFTLSLEEPPDLSLIDRQDITLNVWPDNLWLESHTLKKPIFTVNPITTGFVLLVLMSLGVFACRRLSTGGSAEKEEPCILSNIQPVTVTSPKTRPILTGIEGRILHAYHRGLETVEKVTGVDMSPHITLREFLKMASLLAPTAMNQFAELTVMAEVTLYSNTHSREDAAARAEKLATLLTRELHHGTS